MLQKPEKARFQRLDPEGPTPYGEVVEVLFNPAQLSVGRSFEIASADGKRTQPPLKQAVGVRTGDLTLELIFDTTDRGTAPDRAQNVREAKPLKSLLDMVNVETTPPGPGGRRGAARKEPAPVVVRFSWGTGFWYDGFIKSLEERITMFASDGTPVRASVTVTMEAYTSPARAEEAKRPQGSQTVRWIVQRGETLSGIAAQAYRDPTEWPRIANANNLNDPKSIVPGQILWLPTLE